MCWWGMVSLCKVCDWLGFFPFLAIHSLSRCWVQHPVLPWNPSCQGHWDLWVVHFCLYISWLPCSLGSVAILFSTVFYNFPSCRFPASLLPEHLFTAAISGNVGLLFLLCILSLSNLILSNIYHFVNFQKSVSLLGSRLAYPRTGM